MAKHLKDTSEDSAMAKCPSCGHVFNIEYECNRCHHKWVPRENGEPKVCPSCKSPYWNKERVRGIAKPIEAKSSKAKR